VRQMSRGRHYRQMLCHSVRTAEKEKVLIVCACYLFGKYKRLRIYCLVFICLTGEGLADFTVSFNCHLKIRAVVFSSRLPRASLDFPPTAKLMRSSPENTASSHSSCPHFSTSSLPPRPRRLPVQHTFE